ncbi:SGNH hydrolase-type esterase domain-containing protein [Cokeromyces recurvatus]|uniref:SGNH hydrolase-type esterase domain-containing protein n=1 Tax=Cokeromyces recurvatus TaxID=90255 RepID=UPI00221F7C9B|nr:SGNH hydrolase-type esterase domain-containing protein [Cokeromyces recurvatus]KAI7905662.1 SGNH hydrolase-type esterase domain-containing protein [Cokeromyces recurvatus]
MTGVQGYVYESTSHFQVLQRNPETNIASILIDGEIVEYKVGGPYTIGKAHNVYVGDIWIMAGQSNMRGHGFLMDPFTKNNLMHESLVDSIHLFNSSEQWTLAKDPTHRLVSSPRQVHHTLPDPTVRDPKILEYRGASLGLAFAKKYQQLNHHVPVGLVASAHGGTTLEDWKRPLNLFSSRKNNDDDPFNTTLYGAMIARIEQVGPITGILWYQGESDTVKEQDAVTYKERFLQWLQDLRQDLKRDNLPVAFVQIGSHRVDDPEMIKNWKIVQDGQRKLFDYHHFTAGVASFDGSLDDRLHLSATALNKVGERLAIAATCAKQGLGKTATPLPVRAVFESSSIPTLKETGIPSSIRVEFEHVNDHQGWMNKLDEEIYGFEIECADKEVVLLSVRINDDKQWSLRLYLTSKPKAPIYISYGMNQEVKGNLIRSDGMAVPAFQKFEVFFS